MDVVESLAIDRAKQLFGAEHANVQPHSGAQANMAVYLAVLKPGDTILGMNLAHGGHLTHGHPLNFSGKLLQRRALRRARRRRADRLRRVGAQAREHKPKLIIVGASAYPRVIDFARIRAVADEVGALMLPTSRTSRAWSPPASTRARCRTRDFVTTTTHKTLRGPRGGLVLAAKTHAKDIDRAVFPGRPGRAADAHHRRQGRRLKEALDAGLRRLSAADRRERRAPGQRHCAGASASSAAEPTTT